MSASQSISAPQRRRRSPGHDKNVSSASLSSRVLQWLGKRVGRSIRLRGHGLGTRLVIGKLSEELKLLKAQLESGGSLSQPTGETKEQLEKLRQMQAMDQQFEEEEADIINRERNLEEQLQEEARIREEMERKLEMLRNAKVGGRKEREHRPVVSEEEKKQYEEMKQEVEEQQQQEVALHRQETLKQDTKKNLEAITDDFEEMSEKFTKLQEQ